MGIAHSRRALSTFITASLFFALTSAARGDVNESEFFASPFDFLRGQHLFERERSAVTGAHARRVTASRPAPCRRKMR